MSENQIKINSTASNASPDPKDVITPFKETSLVEILGLRALHTPDKVAYRFIHCNRNVPDEELVLTYVELNERVRTLAAMLQSKTELGERVLLLYPNGPDFVVAFFACLYAGVIAVPSYPPTVQTVESGCRRLENISKSAILNVCLCSNSIDQLIQSDIENFPVLESMTWFVTDTSEQWAKCVEHEKTTSWVKPAIKREDLAFLQYTSGSTGDPKGVMVTHSNLVHNLESIRRGSRLKYDETTVSWLPCYHDMGLVDGLLSPIFCGAEGVVMPQEAFLERPKRWLQAMSDYNSGHSGAPNFAYELCTKRINNKELSTLDLSCWTEVAYCGAEPIRKEVLVNFCKKFTKCGFQANRLLAVYGLAEATLVVTESGYHEVPKVISVQKAALKNNTVDISADLMSEHSSLVSCGRAAFGVHTSIIDPDTRKGLPENQVGEIWLTGPNVTKGYWRDDELTSDKYHATRTDGVSDHYFRTGDLGFVHDGDLFVTGRLKDLIIVRGKNYYPQDIEFSVEQAHADIRQSTIAAFSVEDTVEGEGMVERLVVIFEVATRAVRKNKFDEIFSAVRAAIAANHQLSTYKIVIANKKEVPRTTSGKIQRSKAKLKLLENEIDVLGFWCVDGSSVSGNKSFIGQVEGEGIVVQGAEKVSVSVTGKGNLMQELMELSDVAEKEQRLASALIKDIANLVAIPPEDISPTQVIGEMGLESIHVVGLHERLEYQLGKSFSISTLLDYRDIKSLASGLIKKEVLPYNPSDSLDFNDSINSNDPVKIKEVDFTSIESPSGELMAELITLIDEQSKVELVSQVLILNIAGLIKMPVSELSPLSVIGEVGLDSIHVVELHERMEHQLDKNFSISTLLNHRDIVSLAQAIVKNECLVRQPDSLLHNSLLHGVDPEGDEGLLDVSLSTDSLNGSFNASEPGSIEDELEALLGGDMSDAAQESK